MVNLDSVNKKEMEKFADIPKERAKIIHDSSANIENNFPINELASKLHPKKQFVRVSKIIEENEGAKTFILEADKEHTKELAYFKPGQYISIEVPINGGLYHRPYTISSSSKKVFETGYSITIKKAQHGLVSNYFLEQVKENDIFKISGPSGTFCYEPLRDASHIIAIAGGSGITPFMSMAEAILDGTTKCSLTILYGVKSKEDIILKDRLEAITTLTDKVKLAYVMIVDDKEFASSFIDKELLDKYVKEKNSFFVSGPNSMYERVNEVLKKYHIPNKYVRHDSFLSNLEPESKEEFTIKVLTQKGEKIIKCNGQETLLSAMERNGIEVPSKCNVGECGFCRSKLVLGKVKTFANGIRVGDKELNYIHPCASFPESDITLRLPK